MGYESVTPLSALARGAIDAYLARNPRAGDVPLFPELRRPNDCASRDIAEHWPGRPKRRQGSRASHAAAITPSVDSSRRSDAISPTRTSWPRPASAPSP